MQKVSVLIAIFFAVSACATSMFSSLPMTSKSMVTDTEIYSKNQTVVSSESALLRKTTRSALLGLNDGFRVAPYTYAFVDLQPFDSLREQAVKEGKNPSEIELMIASEKKELVSKYRLESDSCFMVEFHASSYNAREEGSNSKYWGVEVSAFANGKEIRKPVEIEFEQSSLKMSTTFVNQYGVKVHKSDDWSLFNGQICVGEKIDYSRPFSLTFSPRYSINSESGAPSIQPFIFEWLPEVKK